MKESTQIFCNASLSLEEAEFFSSFLYGSNEVGWKQQVTCGVRYWDRYWDSSWHFSRGATQPLWRFSGKTVNTAFCQSLVFSVNCARLYNLSDTLLRVHLKGLEKKKTYSKISLKHITKKAEQFDQIFTGQMTSPPLASYLVIEIIGCYHWNTWKHKWCKQLFLPAPAKQTLLQQFQQDPCSLHRNEGQTEVKKLCQYHVNRTSRKTNQSKGGNINNTI